jgi:preprotein translocase subunit YajC
LTPYLESMQMLLFFQASPGGGNLFNLLLFPLLLVIMYFFFIRPQQKKQKDQTAFQKDIKKGDEVVTLSGMIGRVNKLDGEIISLEIGTKSYVNILKSSISKEMTEAYRKGTPAKLD